MPRRRIDRLSLFAAIIAIAASSTQLSAGDNCATPTTISGSGPFPFNLSGATFSGEGQDHCVVPPATHAFDNDEWFCWTADCTGLVAVSTCGQTIGTKVAMYINGCACPTPPPSQPPLCCNADMNSPCSGQPLFTCEVVCGQQYLFRIGKEPGSPPDSGTFTLNCQGTPCANECDNCCGKRPNFITNAGFVAGVAAVTQQEGINNRVIDFINIGAPQPPTGSNVNWFAPFYTPTAVQDWTRVNLGTVFGVTLNNLGDVFVAHTSVYGDFINGPGDSIGTIAGGAAGAIYKINSNTGVPFVFAVLPNAQIIGCSGTDCWPGLGNICYSCTHDSFYVSNHEDGRIYRLDPSGTVQQTWKHSTGTLMNGGGLDPNDTNGFSPLGPHATTQRGQRVWAVRTNADRLYYSVWREDGGRPDAVRSNEIWSIGLFPNGGFIPGTEQLEITMPVYSGNYSNPVADISFRPNTCCMLLAERTMQDDTNSNAHQSRLLEYCRSGTTWSPSSNVFFPGDPIYPALNSSAGGCDYDFHTGAGINVNVWATSDAIKVPPSPPGVDPWIYGIGGMPITGGNPYSSGLMIDSNQFTANHDKFLQGSVQITCPAPNPPICEPLADGTGCQQVQCDSPVLEECQPKCILVGKDGVTRISECDCDPVDQCHAVFVPGSMVPECTGICPQGQVCIQRVNPRPDGTEYCCECVDDPPECVPASDGQSCVPYVCEDPAAEACKPRCVRMDNHGGISIINCDCRGIDECHAVWDAGTTPYCAGGCPPGMTCLQNIVMNGDGSFDICCDCVDQHCDCPGDVNGDGVLNGADIAGFVRCYLGVAQPDDNCACVDINGDGIHDQIDVDLFVELILTKAPCEDPPCCPRKDLDLNLASGVDGQGNLIPVGNDDDDWVVTVDASGGTVPRQATVVTPHLSWVSIPGAQWVSADYFGPNGTYEYKFCFCLDDRFKNPILTMQLAADDSSQVFFNGTLLGPGGGFSGPPASYTVNNPALFVAGENCVTVVVQNIGGAPTGMIFAGNVTADDGQCCCPPADLSKSVDSGVYDNGGGLIPVSMDDDTWTVTCEPAPGGTLPRPATVINPHPAWLTIPGTQWVSAAQYGPNGWYCYEYCFCLDPRFKNPILNLDLRADDYAEVYLNGVLVGQTSMGWAFNTPQPFNIFVTNPSLFRACENCIEIKVLNGGGVVTGFNVAGTITADDGLCCDQGPALSCCQLDGTCIDLPPGVTKCPGFGVPFEGPCETPRGCCMPDGMCQVLEPHCCEQFGGTALPAGVTCGGEPQACCIPGGVAGGAQCLTIDPACCSAFYGGTPQGPGTTCLGDNDGNGIDDACEDSPECRVNSATGFCNPTQCPAPGEECLSVCALFEAATGQFVQVVDCDCRMVSDCHMEFTPAPITPICNGQDCPPGTTCQQVVTDIGGGLQKICCECVPDQPAPCVPDPVAIACSATPCETPDETCLPVCVRIDTTGVVSAVSECDCKQPTECHIEWDAGFANPHCVGACPPGESCTTVFTVNPDGTQDMCCRCEPDTSTYCPLTTDLGSQLCASMQQTQCPSPVPTTGACKAQFVISNGPGAPPTVQGCSCFEPDSCGAVSIQELSPGNWHITCGGGCLPMPGWNCYVHVDGMPIFSGSVDPATLPPGSMITCRCAP